MNVNNKNNLINTSALNATSKINIEEKEINPMENSINELIQMIEFGGVPEYGKFHSVSSKYQNVDKKLNASDITLSIEPSILIDERPKEREIAIKVYSKNMARSYSVVLCRGEMQDLLKHLKSEELLEKIDLFVKEASSKFNEYD